MYMKHLWVVQYYKEKIYQKPTAQDIQKLVAHFVHFLIQIY